jgi:membrane-bound lytic murein transglycosylase D
MITGSQASGIYLPPDDGQPLSPQEIEALTSVGDFDTQVTGQDLSDVILHFKYYVHKSRRTVTENVQRAALYLPHIRGVLARNNLSPELAWLPFIESGYKTQARSRTGALGLWQFIGSTGAAYGLTQNWWLDERRDPYESTQAAAEYLTKLYGMFKDWGLAITAYNAGEGRVSRALAATGTDNFFALRRRNESVPEKDRLSDENKQYLPRFLAVCKIMRNLGRLGFAEPDPAGARQFIPVAVKSATDLLGLARALRMNWEDFSSYNPAYSRHVSPPGRSSTIYLPPDRAAVAEELLLRPKAITGPGWRHYTVKQGDTLSRVATQSGMPARELRRGNQISEPLQAGKVLRIPGRTGTAVASASKRAAPSAGAGSPAAVRRQASATGGGVHTVRAGDTVYALSRAWAVTPAAVLKANNLSDNRLSIGQRLIIPGADAQKSDSARSASAALPDRYRVRAGDTLWGIARTFSLSTTELMRINNLTKTSRIKPGDTLRLAPR